MNINTLLYRNSKQIFSDIDGEILMLNVDKSEYYNLESTARDIWNLLEKPKTLKDIIEFLVEDYNITFEDCLRDVQQFLEELIYKGVVISSND